MNRVLAYICYANDPNDVNRGIDAPSQYLLHKNLKVLAIFYSLYIYQLGNKKSRKLCVFCCIFEMQSNRRLFAYLAWNV